MFDNDFFAPQLLHLPQDFSHMTWLGSFQDFFDLSPEDRRWPDGG